MTRQVELVPEEVHARSLLAVQFGALNRVREAVAELEKTVALRPKDPNTLYNAACTYGIVNLKEEALLMFRRAVESSFSNPDWAARDSEFRAHPRRSGVQAHYQPGFASRLTA